MNLIKEKRPQYFIVFILLALVVTLVLPAGNVLAFSPNYNTNDLIDNPTFTDTTTMGPNDIKTFLQNEGSGLLNVSDVEACDSTIAPYYSHCGQTLPAYQIISDAANAYGVNPRTILATLEKEQSLVTDPSPSASQINCAMGYNSCSNYVGFFTQVDNGAWVLRFNYEAASNNPSWLSWSPASNYPCSTSKSLYSTGLYPGNAVTFADPAQYDSNGNLTHAATPETVTLENAATASLYCYTPYVGPISETGYSGSYNFVYYFQLWWGTTYSDSFELNFVRLDDSSGFAQIVGSSSGDSYQTIDRYFISGYPDVPSDGWVIPISSLNSSNIAFVRLDHSSGHVEFVQYGLGNGYASLNAYSITGYPDVANDGCVVPLLSPNGNLNFIRLNYSAGYVQVVSYSPQSNYTQLIANDVTAYPDVDCDGSVVPLYTSDGDLAFVRLNHSSGHVEVVKYSASSGYKQMTGYDLSSYPAVTPDGHVAPVFLQDGDLGFVNLEYPGNYSQIVTYSESSGYQTMTGDFVTAYPSVSDFTNVKPLITK